ncbi:nitrilase-related carbon-nitrogen hydrolase, partial [Clostridium sp.]|uniref:nitrilase-related carbon-nitrogen hydrolase n=1 Tax=Clostridium sp. TaxID=1506 RepID=UPI002614A600
MDFIKISAACPVTKVADVDFNLENIFICIDKAYEENSKSIVFPELSITSYTCNDLFLQSSLLNKSNEAIEKLIHKSIGLDMLVTVGAPLLFNNSLYNCAYIIFEGQILGIIPKSFIPNYNEFYEKRWFSEGFGIFNEKVDLSFQKDIPFGTNLIFKGDNAVFGFEICEDLWVTIPPSSYLSLLGANVISNLSASNELVSKKDYREDLIKNQSARSLSAYIYSSAGVHESSTDVLFSGHLIISENGSIIKENKRFQR